MGWSLPRPFCETSVVVREKVGQEDVACVSSTLQATELAVRTVAVWGSS